MKCRLKTRNWNLLCKMFLLFFRRLFFIHFLFQCFFCFLLLMTKKFMRVCPGSTRTNHAVFWMDAGDVVTWPAGSWATLPAVSGCRKWRQTGRRRFPRIMSGAPKPVRCRHSAEHFGFVCLYSVSCACVCVCVWILHMCVSHQPIPEGSIAGHCRESQEERTAEGPDVSAHGA